MALDRDFKEFILLLNEQKVEYLVIGGYAVVFHGYPRFTGDIDFWINPTEENIDRVLAVLKKFGCGSLGVKREDLLNPDIVHQFGQQPLRIDILSYVEGASFAECYRRKKTKTVGGVKIHLLSREDLIRNKQLVGRPRDLEDVKQLRKHKR
jgi:predicted nucleotidyltransferase